MGDTGMLGRRRYLPKQAKHAGNRMRFDRYASAYLNYTPGVSDFQWRLKKSVLRLGLDEIFPERICL
jgi:hypothetical protein